MRHHVLPALAALIAGFTLVSTARAEQNRPKLTPAAPKCIEFISKETCIGAPMPKTDEELARAIDGCKGDTSCILTAVKARERRLEMEFTRNAFLRYGVIGFTIVGKALEELRADGAGQPAPLFSSDELKLFDEAIANVRAARTAFEKIPPMGRSPGQ